MVFIFSSGIKRRQGGALFKWQAWDRTLRQCPYWAPPISLGYNSIQD
jgi:hypothetical protein